MTIAEIRQNLRDVLIPKYGEREATAMSRMVIMSLKRWNMAQMLADEGREASDFIINRVNEIREQLLDDMPIQYSLGEAYFYGLTLKVKPGVLIPRPETEELVDLIVKENKESDLKVLDVGCGSGAIAVALARNLPFSKVTALDVSPVAVEVTKSNAEALKAKIRVLQCDIFTDEFPHETFDIIVSNPPYIDMSERSEMERNVLEYEPAEALFVPDADPLIFYKRIIAVGEKVLLSGGRLYFEINPRHAPQLRDLLEKEGFTEVEIVKDIHGKERFAKAVKA